MTKLAEGRLKGHGRRSKTEPFWSVWFSNLSWEKTQRRTCEKLWENTNLTENTIGNTYSESIEYKIL